MYDQDMPKFMWAEVCNTAVYVQNRTPHRALGKVTPEKIFTGKTPGVSHFRIFGSLAHCCILEEKRKKLDTESTFQGARSFKEATQHQVWLDTMVEEYNSIMVNDVWEVVPRPQDRSVVGSRWSYNIKYAADDSVEKYKARFVAEGYAQKEGIDYKETFAPVARYTSIRTVISFSAQMGWEIH
eukprot:PITA_19811